MAYTNAYDDFEHHCDGWIPADRIKSKPLTPNDFAFQRSNSELTCNLTKRLIN